MDHAQLLSSLLVSVGYRLPVMIALGVALVLLLGAPKAAARSAALWALAILMAVTLFGAALSVLPLLMIAAGNFDGIAGLNTWLGIGHFMLSLLEAAGFVLLAWALARALRGNAGAPG
ncbi:MULTISPECIES: hypothetical protein [Stenotrophomonas]|uniref:Transmembrane protein n=1 Tax=Stenotrophomonas nitritireducens TaxID=83617 RepID=A0ABR5NP98_9GAMM|nr:MULTISPECIES: hypothetical protein [Stenotrophomonas]KQO00427.1 hypothetical protein ASF01_05615 [Stenotrophomonas sp. Leaf70]KRG60605.1 hypothetical protein ABB22_01560 [Stenotrophomonas nitritireducens]